MRYLKDGCCLELAALWVDRLVPPGPWILLFCCFFVLKRFPLKTFGTLESELSWEDRRPPPVPPDAADPQPLLDRDVL